MPLGNAGFQRQQKIYRRLPMVTPSASIFSSGNPRADVVSSTHSIRQLLLNTCRP